MACGLLVRWEIEAGGPRPTARSACGLLRPAARRAWRGGGARMEGEEEAVGGRRGGVRGEGEDRKVLFLGD